MHIRSPIVILVSAVVALTLTNGAAIAAVSPPSNTTATFSLTSGDLTLTTQATAALKNAVTGSTDISGQLGQVTVLDRRGTTVAWAVSASSTQFVGDDADRTKSVSVTYASGEITKLGGVTVTGGVAKPITSGAALVVAPTVVHGSNAASWNPTVHVNMPISALVGTYSATITTSIL